MVKVCVGFVAGAFIKVLGVLPERDSASASDDLLAVERTGSPITITKGSYCALRVPTSWI